MASGPKRKSVTKKTDPVTASANREQEREEDLNAGQRDAKLVQELDHLSVEPLVLPLALGHVPGVPRVEPAHV